MLTLKVKPSRHYAILLMLISLGSVFLSLIHWLLFIPVLLYFLYTAYSTVLMRSKYAIALIEYHEAGQWTLTQRSGEVIDAYLLSKPVTLSFLTILHFQNELTEKSLSIVLFSDACNSSKFRQLTVLLTTNPCIMRTQHLRSI